MGKVVASDIGWKVPPQHASDPCLLVLVVLYIYADLESLFEAGTQQRDALPIHWIGGSDYAMTSFGLLSSLFSKFRDLAC